jgi:hypothetical protein
MSHLYWHFLMYQNHLDQRAAEMEKEGKSGTSVKSFLQGKLNMPDNRFELIHQAARRLSASMSDLNARAEKLRAKLIETHPSKSIPPTSEQEQLRSALQMLNDEREAILLREMDRLDNELATEDRARFREFMLRTIAPNVRSINRPGSLTPKSSVATGLNGGSR